jgi:hypothetical protein
MTHHESTLSLVAKGAVAGLAGTAALTAGLMLMPHVLPQTGPFDPERDQPQEPQEKLVESVMLALWGSLPDDTTKLIAGQATHWGYGATWGVIYALAQQQLNLPPNLHGLLLGGLVGTTASTIVPALNLSPPPTQEPLPQTAMMTGLQLLFGWVTAQTFDALSSAQDQNGHDQHRQQGRQDYRRRAEGYNRRPAMTDRFGHDPYATHRYPGRPDGEVIERRFHEVDAPMPRRQQSLAEPMPQYAPPR